MSMSKSSRPSESSPVLAFTKHDHKRCIRTGLASADTLCGERSVRLTPVRRRTLEILLQSHTALGAYEVLDRLALAGFGGKPPQVYRALQFLIEHGFVHKLEALNAYVACVSPNQCERPCFMVCVECGRVAEHSVPKVTKQLNVAAQQAGFSPSKSVMELSGVCNECPSQS